MENMVLTMLVLLQDNDYLGPKFKGGREYHEASQLDLEKIVCYLKEVFEIECVQYKDFNAQKNYKGYYVIYSSNEARGHLYKSYIEDILLKLQHDGAFLIPDFYCFRAHGNKAFQELLRKSFHNEELRRPLSAVIGRFGDIDVRKFRNYPYVVKSSTGSGSSGVRLANNRKELLYSVQKLSRVKYQDYYYTGLRDFVYIPIVWKLKRLYYKLRGRSQSVTPPPRKLHENKTIIQEYIQGLASDYKVLYYYGKYYVLNRLNRNHDFRASGSGKFIFPKEIAQVKTILSFAQKAAQELDAPMISMDIAQKGDKCFLIEFQFVGFGPYTVQYAEWHFERNGDAWIRVEGKDDIDIETARSIKEYILLHRRKRISDEENE